MLKIPFAFLAILLLTACVSAPEPSRRGPPPDPATERGEALQHGGDAAAGKEAYEVCAACHLPSGFGRADGTYPRLAGQHATVLVKQIADIRGLARENSTMHSFSLELRGARDVANVAAYIEGMCVPSGNGRYTDADADSRIAEGKRLYDRDCVDCHGAQAQGNREKFYPVLAGQHYRYLLRQVADIRDGYRANVDPDMVSTLKKHGNPALESLSAYLASLPAPGIPCEPRTARGSAGNG